MRWTRWRQAQFVARRMTLSRTVKSRGPGAPTLALSSWLRTTNDGGKKARSPGRSRISRNTIVQGMPADAVYPWLLTPVLFSAQAATGATRIRHSLRPLLRRAGHSRSNLAQNRRRDREAVSAILSRPILRDAADAAPQDEVVIRGATLDPRETLVVRRRASAVSGRHSRIAGRTMRPP
jgi:hypothetical protein